MFAISIDSAFFLNSLRLNLRNANLQAKANLRKAAQEEAIYLLSYLTFCDVIWIIF